MASKKPGTKSLKQTQKPIPAPDPPAPPQTPPTLSNLPPDYAQVLVDLKDYVAKAQTKAVLAVNQDPIALYLYIGQTLSERIASSRWGDKIIRRLAQDLRDAFPAMSGFSRTNLFYMCQVYNAWSTFDMPVQQAVGLIPWSHHLVIVSKVSEPSARLFYLQETITHCWSRAVLTAQIETGLHTRQGRALSNFSLALPGDWIAIRPRPTDPQSPLRLQYPFPLERRPRTWVD